MGVNYFDEAPKDLSNRPHPAGSVDVVGQQGAFGGTAGVVRNRSPEEYQDDYQAGVYNAGQEQVGPNSAETEVDRYRGLASGSQGRQSYQLQFGKALGNEVRANDVRNKGEMDALAGLRTAAQGGAPSRAVIEGNQVAGNSLESALAAGAGARGGGTAMGQPRGQANPLLALSAQSGQQLGGVSRGIGARSDEMGANRNAYGAGASVIRGQDYAGQGLAQDRAEAQAKSDIAQRHLNDARELGFERDSVNVRKAQQSGILSMEEIQAQKDAAAARAKEAQTSTGEDIARGAGQAIINFSDRKAKNVGGNALARLMAQAKRMQATTDASKESLKYGSSLDHSDELKKQGDEALAGVNAQRESLKDGPLVGKSEPTPEPRELGSATGGEVLRQRDESELPRHTNPLRAMMLKEPEAPSAMPEKMDATNPYAHRSLFGNAPEGYAASRRGHAGYMFGKAPEASYGDLRGSERDESAGLAPGSADAAHGEGHSLNKKDARISLSDENAKNKAPSTKAIDAITDTAKTDTATKAMDLAGASGSTHNAPFKMAMDTLGSAMDEADKPRKNELADSVPEDKTPAVRQPRTVALGSGATTSNLAGPARGKAQPVFEAKRTAADAKEEARLKVASSKNVRVSDENAKETKGGPLSELQRDANRKMRGETYTYKEGFGEDPEQVHHGFMAQTLEENPITALAVRDDPSGYKKVDNTDMLRVTAAGVAENQNQIDDMAEELAKLKARRSRRT